MPVSIDESPGKRRQIANLRATWHTAIKNSLVVFDPQDCFRRADNGHGRRVINRALMDLTMTTLADMPDTLVNDSAENFKRQYSELFRDEELCAVTRRHFSAGANPARQLSLQPVTVGADDGGNDIV